jgi:hypothetical protein
MRLEGYAFHDIPILSNSRMRSRRTVSTTLHDVVIAGHAYERQLDYWGISSYITLFVGIGTQNVQ